MIKFMELPKVKMIYYWLYSEICLTEVQNERAQVSTGLVNSTITVTMNQAPAVSTSVHSADTRQNVSDLMTSPTCLPSPRYSSLSSYSSTKNAILDNNVRVLGFIYQDTNNA